MTDFFNLFFLEFLGAFEHLTGVVDVIYIGQLPPVREIHGHALSQFPPNLRSFSPISYMAKFCAEESSK